MNREVTKAAKNRKIFLSTATGVLLAGIKYSKKTGLHVPAILKVMNRSEYGEDSQALQQPIGDLTREVLADRVREKLKAGVPLWPNEQRRRADW